MVIFGGVGGIVGCSFAGGGLEVPLMVAGVFSVMETTPWWLAVVAAAALAVDVGLYWALLRRQEVKL